MTYRIKITEQNDGVKWYTPQVTIPGSKLLKMFGYKDKWLNVISLFGGTVYEENETLTMSWPTEQEAMDVINGHKLYYEGKLGKQTKSITYIVPEL
jgi:hypothetical protein